MIDPHSTELTLPKPIPVLDQICEFHKIDERFQGQKNRYVFGCTNKDAMDWAFLQSKWGGKTSEIVSDSEFQLTLTMQADIHLSMQSTCLIWRLVV